MINASVVNLETYTDADFVEAFQLNVNDVPFDFTGYSLMMMVRKLPEDEEVFLSLTSSTTGIVSGESGIDIYQTNPPSGDYDIFSINIVREDLVKIPVGEYVHSLLLVSADGKLRDDIWRGTLTHAIGPTR